MDASVFGMELCDENLFVLGTPKSGCSLLCFVPDCFVPVLRPRAEIVHSGAPVTVTVTTKSDPQEQYIHVELSRGSTGLCH